ncbi:MAG: hypothetical protein MUC88_21510, partial [Planctomycetes bacterium]|nr:hypothetical protein [Planctomycetota bacterium]
MQTLGWYYRRLRAMSAGEVAWRVQASLCDRLDRLLVGRRQQPRPPAEILEGDGNTPGFRFCTLGVGEWERANALDDVRREWRHALLEKAEKIAQHRLSFFDL